MRLREGAAIIGVCGAAGGLGGAAINAFISGDARSEAATIDGCLASYPRPDHARTPLIECLEQGKGGTAVDNLMPAIQLPKFGVMLTKIETFQYHQGLLGGLHWRGLLVVQ